MKEITFVMLQHLTNNFGGLFSFSEKGHLANCEAQLRRKMILALQETSLCPQPEDQSEFFPSARSHALAFLVAEFLQGRGYPYTLSVFASEARLPPAGGPWPWDSGRDRSSLRLARRDVEHVLGALGLPAGSREAASVCDAYEAGREPLLPCVVQGLLPVPAVDTSLPAGRAARSPKVKRLVRRLKRHYRREVSEARARLEGQHERAVAELRALHQRDLEDAWQEHRAAEETHQRREEALVRAEALARAEVARHDAEARETQDARARLARDAMQLQHQRNEIDMRVRFLEDYLAELRQRENNFQEESQRELSLIAEQRRKQELKQKQLDEGFRRLEEERAAVRGSYERLLQASASAGVSARLRPEPARPSVRHGAQQTDPLPQPRPQEGQTASSDTVRQLRDENCELRMYVRQLRQRISELILQSVQVAKQLESAHDAVRLLSSRPAQQAAPRERDGSPRPGAAAHSSSSGDSDGGSPTDAVLRETRDRLRELEEESEAVDRSYERFRLRQTRSLAEPALHDLLQRYRRSQHATPLFLPPPPSTVPGGHTLLPGVPRTEHPRNYLPQPPAPIGSIDASPVSNDATGSSEIAATNVTIDDAHKAAVNRRLVNSNTVKDYGVRQTSLSFSPQETQADSDKLNLNASAVELRGSFQEALPAVRDQGGPLSGNDKMNGNIRDITQEPLVRSDKLENGTLCSRAKEPLEHSDGVENWIEQSMSVNTEMLGNENRHNLILEPAIGEGVLENERNSNIIEQESKFQASAASNEQREFTQQDEALMQQAINKCDVSEDRIPETAVEPQSESVVIKTGLQQEEGEVEGSLGSSQSEAGSSEDIDGGVSEPEAADIIAERRVCPEVSQEQAPERQASTTRDPSPVASVHSHASAELGHDREIQEVLTEGSLSSVALSSDQAVSAGRKSDEDDDSFW
ncbi:uncharacterized protein LOC134541019 isoform X2 [Bacillus rossius redtenbacheri]|uniref:uncharacterized protein LOC134541019 isoform X2 n=1 Tax=Bacillus rossius redtenbacheri TaxID=93214 RepID=UPI002FDDD541